MRSLNEAVVTVAAALLGILGAHLLALSSMPAMALVAFVTSAAAILSAARARAQQARRTTAYIQRLIDGIPDAFYIKDADSRYVMVNKTYAAERGRSPEDIIGKTTLEVAGNARSAAEWEQEDRTALAGSDVYVEQKVRHVVTGEESFRILSKRRVENERGVAVVVGAHLDITKWKLTERDLQAALVREQNYSERVRDYLQRLFDVIPMPVYVKDAESRYLIVNTAQEREWGKTKAELIGVNSISLAPNETVAATIAREDAAVLGGETVYKEEHKRHAATGAEQFRVVTKGRCVDPDGQQVIICTLFDTTRWRVAERNLRTALDEQTTLRERTQSFIQRVIDVIRDPFYIKDAEGHYLMVNDALARERQLDKSRLLGQSSYSNVDSLAMAAESQREDRAVIGGAEVDKELHYHTSAGNERFIQVVKRRCTNVDASPVIVVAHFDITRWRVAERELARMAHEDALTRLANRRCFLVEMERAISRADRHEEALSIVLFDLDHFKRVNDEHGHPIGDEVLVEVARRTRSSLRGEDTPCRWGGEEFVVLLPQMGAEEALIVANRLRDAVEATPVMTSIGDIAITTSCGVAQRQVGELAMTLITRADRALYKAKSGGRNMCMTAVEASAA